MPRGMISAPPVQHWGTVVIGRGPAEEFHHRLDAGTAPGAYECGFCGRWVFRGLGRWWEAGDGLAQIVNTAIARRTGA